MSIILQVNEIMINVVLWQGESEEDGIAVLVIKQLFF